ncbi:hypothetical protein [Burkholderia lata]|uniref:Fimbrial assembly protein n=1 Tax=Burkholderia lata (strain ATCC 17760 / DSM 23089 / LMG 22485 / NCIMB 9086 / R18194 / 383) TaxID=482957 RepID=Q390Y2_BURL3|nr:hypothetical protein [Burkholderia lata]ABB12984.1 hypothetical protein Bcep18194_B2873 [Burkholderia lata]
MQKIILNGLLAALVCVPMFASAKEKEGILLVNGKTTSKVTAKVVRMNNLIVTDEKGTWFPQGLTMQQLGGWDTAYEVEARLLVAATTGSFQVRMDQPLDIRNQAKPTLAFRKTAVSIGAEGGEPKPMVVGQPIEFTNPVPPSQDIDSKGFYSLAVAAFPPEGDFKSTAGTYTGELSLVFEPIVPKQK